MKKIIVWLFLFLCNVVIALPINKCESSCNDTPTIDCCKSNTNINYTITMMPLYFSKQQIISPPQLESNTNETIYNKLVTLPNNVKSLNESINCSFILEKTESSLTNWQNDASTLKNLLQNTHLHESIEIPTQYIPKQPIESQFIMIGYLQNLSFSEYNDRIPSTNLTSVIHDFLVHIQYYIISVPHGKLVAKFTITGHSSTSTLILNHAKSMVNNYYYSHNLINNAFYDLSNNVHNYLIANPLVPSKKPIKTITKIETVNKNEST